MNWKRTRTFGGFILHDPVIIYADWVIPHLKNCCLEVFQKAAVRCDCGSEFKDCIFSYPHILASDHLLHNVVKYEIVYFGKIQCIPTSDVAEEGSRHCLAVPGNTLYVHSCNDVSILYADVHPFINPPRFLNCD